ncbi:S-layer homology domain-containing protein [Paenibacillus sp. N1-5-1-14]|uniref:S-layer homology domain-containing protein n=1 Tax=Paenibacillus radicibacter TaxID=2972488 RepID=UPI00215908B2|nr:S-layer homology domain-containing protein [Paenibacillus radicibacter]MCR8642800.1 S-layer homology domain-containing protein [Paenibacillus radicibacter]
MFNRKRLLKCVLTSISSLLILAMFPISAFAQSKQFTDVPSDHWANESVTWAYEQGIVAGYPDGTFKPDQIVGQNDFLAMLIRAYVPQDQLPSNEDTSDWMKPYVKYAYQMQWSTVMPPPSKLDDMPWAPKGSARSNVTLQRHLAATILTNASGRSYEIDDSIQFLLDSGIVHGRTDSTVEGFEGSKYLTRAEAVTIIKQFKSKTQHLYPSPYVHMNYDPAALHQNPFELYPLEITVPKYDFDIFNTITLTNPTKGYTSTTDTSFTLNGTVQLVVSDHLELQIEHWDGYNFIPVNNQKTLIDNNQFTEIIDLPTEGLYRVTIKTLSQYEGKLNTNTTPITSLYIVRK